MPVEYGELLEKAEKNVCPYIDERYTWTIASNESPSQNTLYEDEIMSKSTVPFMRTGRSSTNEKGVPYIRVSTDKQGESKLGLEAQQQAVYQYALANGIQLINEFTEIESGKKNNRPVLQSALAYCRKHKAVLIIAKLDRLGRSVAFISALMESNVKFVAVDNPNANELMLHIMAAFAQYEREQISRRTKDALAAAKRRGVKLGEQAKKLSSTNRYKAEQFAQQMIPVIEAIKADGFTSVRNITEELNKRRIQACKGAKWHKTSVHSLLKRIEKAKRNTNQPC